MFSAKPSMLVPLLGAAACASAPVLAERLASAEATVRGAVEVGADATPQASLHLEMARDQIAAARKLIANGDTEQAAAVPVNPRDVLAAELAAHVARLLAAGDVEAARVAHDAMGRLLGAAPMTGSAPEVNLAGEPRQHLSGEGPGVASAQRCAYSQRRSPPRCEVFITSLGGDDAN